MNLITSNSIERYEKDLEKLTRQRYYWLWASSIVFCSSIVLIFGWGWLDDLRSKSVWWIIISLMLIISINWWYWTMRVVRKIIDHQALEYYILKSIAEDIKKFKKELQELQDFHNNKFDKL